MKKIISLFLALIFLACSVSPAIAEPQALPEPSPISGVIFGDNTLIVISAVDYEPPNIDQTLGLFTGFPSLGFIAHSYLAGDHIRTMYIGEIITLIYSNGATAQYEVYVIGSTPSTMTMGQIYYQPHEIVFQTCMDDDLRFIVKAKPVKK
jgi:hypothetical protein